VRSLLGGQLGTSIKVQETTFSPRLRLGWAHEFNTDRSATASLSTVLPGSTFTVFGARPASDALVMTAGIDIDLGRAVRIFAQFDGDFAATARSYSGTGGIRLIW
jgi:outer membrane autotransporter protein